MKHNDNNRRIKAKGLLPAIRRQQALLSVNTRGGLLSAPYTNRSAIFFGEL